jgi:1,4-dihydroxy-2-naphthoyl-CoA hydrolase
MATHLDELERLSRELGGASSALDGRLGIEYMLATADRVVARMPVDGNTQPYGTLHGGASCALAEAIGSCAAAIHAGAGRMAVGIELSATHHRPANAGYVTGVASVVHAGRTLVTCDVVITDEQGRRVCTARVTSLLRDRPSEGSHDDRTPLARRPPDNRARPAGRD